MHARDACLKHWRATNLRAVGHGRQRRPPGSAARDATAGLAELWVRTITASVQNASLSARPPQPAAALSPVASRPAGVASPAAAGKGTRRRDLAKEPGERHQQQQAAAAPFGLLKLPTVLARFTRVDLPAVPQAETADSRESHCHSHQSE